MSGPVLIGAPDVSLQVRVADLTATRCGGWVARTVDGSAYAFAATPDDALAGVASAWRQRSRMNWNLDCARHGLLAAETEYRLARGTARTLTLEGAS